MTWDFLPACRGPSPSISRARCHPRRGAFALQLICRSIGTRYWWTTAPSSPTASVRPSCRWRRRPWHSAAIRGRSNGATPGDLTYYYDQASTTGPFSQFRGSYTRYGDVTSLLRNVDDRFVIFGTGEDIDAEFSAAPLPPLSAGWTRDYFFYANGFVKDMDFYEATPFTVAEMPFHAMTAYPYPAAQHYPNDAAATAYRLDWNDRSQRGSANAKGYSFQYGPRTIDPEPLTPRTQPADEGNQTRPRASSDEEEFGPALDPCTNHLGCVPLCLASTKSVLCRCRALSRRARRGVLRCGFVSPAGRTARTVIVKLGALILAAGSVLGLALIYTGTSHSHWNLMYAHIAVSAIAVVLLAAWFFSQSPDSQPAICGEQCRRRAGRCCHRLDRCVLCARLVEQAVRHQESSHGAAVHGPRRRRRARRLLSQLCAGRRTSQDSGEVLHGVRRLRALPSGYLQAVAKLGAPLFFIQQSVVSQEHRVHAGGRGNTAFEVVRAAVTIRQCSTAA